jgi:hypothetical protein
VYSFADLEREKTTIWDGVTNPAAVKHLRGMKPGERLVIYHTGDERSAVGTASVVAVDASDARNPQVKIKAGKAIAKARGRWRKSRTGFGLHAGTIERGAVDGAQYGSGIAVPAFADRSVRATT